MLSYRHGFHAGNHADVLKHWVLAEVLAYFNEKPAPWTYVDTHAGAGLYRLGAGVGGAQASHEFREGIARLWAARAKAPAVFSAYLEAVAAFNPAGRLELYPGSPAIARQFARSGARGKGGDRLVCFERHPRDFAALERLFAGDAQVRCLSSDGFAGALQVLPPPSRRGVILIDPPYEVRGDYVRLIPAVRAMLEKFPQATVLVWYPRLRRVEAEELRRRLVNLAPEDHLRVELQVAPPPVGGRGMTASGLVVLHPPYVWAQRLPEGLPWLAGQLEEAPGQGGWVLEAKIA